MDRLPLYHETNAQSAVPKWWFAVPVIAFAYTLASPRVFPDLVSVPDPLANVTRWLVGLVLGVALLVGVRLLHWAFVARRHRI
jgi:hypothetical protein